MFEKEERIHIWYLLLFAFIQFPLKLTGNLVYLSYLFAYGLPLVYLIININWCLAALKRVKNFKFTLFKLIYFYLFFAALIWPIIFKTYDFSYIYVYWRGMFFWFIKYMFLIAVYEKSISHSKNIEGILKYFIGSIALYVIATLIFTFIPVIRDLMMRILYISDFAVKNYQLKESTTRFGWSGWSGFNETAICTMAVVFICAMVIKNNKKGNEQKYYLTLLIFPLLGNGLYGRTGLYTSLICVILTFFYVILNKNFKYGIRLMILFGVIGVLLFFLKERYEMFNVWYDWVFSAIKRYMTIGVFSDNMGSIKHLTKDMYWMPEMDTFLCGDGRYLYQDGSYYMHTDSGIMRPMLFYGIGNYLLSLTAFFMVISVFIKNMLVVKKRDMKFLFVIFLIAISLFEFKGESLWMFLAVIVPLVLLQSRG